MSAAHKIMTPEEYAASNLKGWHAVHKDYDGFGAVAIRYNDADMCVTLSEENDALIEESKRLKLEHQNIIDMYAKIMGDPPDWTNFTPEQIKWIREAWYGAAKISRRALGE